MANIAISELNTEATTLASDDLFLISKKDGSSFTSAKIKASNANGLANVRFVDGEAVVYISPSGSDDNIELQWKYYGTEQQKNYPLYTLNKACDFLGRFRCISRNNTSLYIISCASGIYSYNAQQNIHHPECSVTGSYVLITPTTDLTNNTNVQFKFTQPKDDTDGNLAIRHYSNCSMRCCHVTSTNKLSVGIYVPDSVRSTIYGVKITNFDAGVSCDNMNWCCVSSFYPDDGQTLSTHVPSDISSVNIGITCNGRCTVYGYIKINSINACMICNGGQISTAYWTPLKFDLKTSGSFAFENWNYGSNLLLGEPLSRTVEINTFSTSKTFASIQELFNITINNTATYSHLGYIMVHDTVATALTTGLNQNKF